MKKLTIFLFLIIYVLTFHASVVSADCDEGWCLQRGECTDLRCNTCDFCYGTNAEGKPLGRIGGGPEEGFGPWGWLSGKTNISASAGVFTDILSNIIGVMTIVAGIWFIFQFIIGGYAYMTAGEEPQKMGNATKKLTSSLIGLVVIVAAYAIISLLGSLLGFDILKPAALINIIGP